jgi:ribosomal protein S1
MSAEIATPSSVEELEPRMALRGKVKRLELYGAFVDIGVGKDALLHISQLNQSNVRNVEDVLSVDEEITVYVLRVDKAEGRIALSMTLPPEMTWDDLKEGDAVSGKVVRIENFGVFVDVGAERPGMVHVSELASGYVQSPSDVVSVGDEVEARILKINKRKRQIDLTMRPAEQEVEEIFDEDEEEVPTAMEIALRRAMAQSDESPEQAVQAKTRKQARDQQEDIISRTLRNHGSS